MILKSSPSLIARAYADPLSWFNLAVDHLPIWALFQLGWGATPLVALYWLENLVLGFFVAARMLAAGLSQLSRGLFVGAGVVFLVPFFIVHYGAFCFGHRIFIITFAAPEMGFPNPAELVGWALSTGAHMGLFLGAMIAVKLAIFLIYFLGRGEIRGTKIDGEMRPPYGRIVTLHLAIILGAAFAIRLRNKQDRQEADCGAPDLAAL